MPMTHQTDTAQAYRRQSDGRIVGPAAPPLPQFQQRPLVAGEGSEGAGQSQQPPHKREAQEQWENRFNHRLNHRNHRASG